MQLIGTAGAPLASAADPAAAMSADGSARLSMPAPELRREAWRWALDHRAEDGSLPSGRAIAGQYGRHERWGRLVKRSGLAGQRVWEPSAFTPALVERDPPGQPEQILRRR